MKFYLYINKNIMFDFLSRNIIAPDSVVKDLKRYCTISASSDKFLFVTHKKLDRKSREKGIAEPEFVCPITLEFSELTERDGKAILVGKEYEYTLDTLSSYTAEKHLGAYLIGEIPFSRVQKIYFDTQEDMDMFSRPSPDYWYPESKYAILPNDFNEELHLEYEDEKVNKISEIKSDEIIADINRREKKRAGILNFINLTNKWQHGRYIFNLDESLRKLFELSDSAVSAILPHFLEVKDKDYTENLSLISCNEKKEINQIIYDCIAEILIKQPYDTKRQSGQIHELLNDIENSIFECCGTAQEKNLVRTIISDIVKLVSGTSNKGPEEITETIPDSTDVLKALMYVAKNPDRYDLFIESLDAYHVDIITKRRAAVLWGYLNGLYGMPGEHYNKDNAALWQFIEWKVQEGEAVSLSVDKPDLVVNNNGLLGITFTEERVVTSSEIREAILAIPKDKIKNAIYDKLLEAAVSEYGTKKKAENKGYAHRVASINMPEIKSGDRLSPEIIKQLEKLLKDSKSASPNKDSLYKDYLEDKAKFDFVFSMDPEYWKRELKGLSEKPDEKL